MDVPPVGPDSNNPYATPTPASRSGPPADPLAARVPDPGSPFAARVAAALVVMLVGAVMVLQQCSALAGGPAPAPTSASSDASQSPAPEAPDASDPLVLQSSMIVRLAHMVPASDRAQLLGQLTSLAPTDDPLARFRVALIAAELAGADAAITRLDTLASGPEVQRVEGLAQDVQLARAALSDAGPASLTQEDRARLTDRHGYFARLLLSQGMPDQDPQREPLISGGGRLMAVLVVAGLGALAVVIASITCVLLLAIRLGQRRVRPAFVPPLPGGSVPLEMVAVLAGGFLLLKLMGEPVVGALGLSPEAGAVLGINLQWLLALVIVYPLLRGVSWSETRRMLGLTRGRGIAREVLAGLTIYFASLPLVLVAIVVALILNLIFGAGSGPGGAPAPVDNPIIELLLSGSPALLLSLFALGTLWAPIVEEIVFRGGMYRHLRAWMGAIAAGALSALTFGVMHGYPVYLLLPVITLGFAFAMQREARGSLVGPIVTHALHNGTILLLLISLFGVAARGL